MSGDRSAYWPAIEKKTGKPMSYWFTQMKQVKGQKYPEQIAFLKAQGFSQAHANALVQFTRGSTSSKRFATVDEYLAQFDAGKQKTARAIITAITKAYPDLEPVIAWNHPILKVDGDYIFGVTIHQEHLLLAPFAPSVLTAFAKRLADYEVNKKTFKVPADWKVDKKLLTDLVGATLAEVGR